MEISFPLMGERLRDERLRLDLQQLVVADACGISRRTLSAWERGEQATNASALEVLDRLGIDVLYVVTGRRSTQTASQLAPAEQELIDAWRTGGPKVRAILSATAAITKND